MNGHRKIMHLVAFGMILSASGVCASTFYVNPYSRSESAPYDSRVTASKSIHTVIPLVNDGDTVLLTDGTHSLTDQVVVVKDVTIRSINGNPSDCIVKQTKKQSWDEAAANVHWTRVFKLNSPGAKVLGVTMTNGFTYNAGGVGSGVLIDEGGGLVSNCVITTCFCSHASNEGAAYLKAGELSGCVITNTGCYYGYASYVGVPTTASALVLTGSSRAENCLIVDNGRYYAGNTSGSKLQTGDVVAVRNTAVLANCTIVGNKVCDQKVKSNRYGVNVASDATVVNCVIADTHCPNEGYDVSVTELNVGGTSSAYQRCVTDSPAAVNANCKTGQTGMMFVDYAGGDYLPKPGGGLVNWGAAIVLHSSVDKAGRNRWQGRMIDVGCYESTPPGLILVVQ